MSAWPEVECGPPSAASEAGQQVVYRTDRCQQSEYSRPADSAALAKSSARRGLDRPNRGASSCAVCAGGLTGINSDRLGGARTKKAKTYSSHLPPPPLPSLAGFCARNVLMFLFG